MHQVIGEWWDYEVLSSGERKLIQSGRNAISADLAIIFAMCVKPGAAAGQGILYWAVGDGGIDGDDQTVASKQWDTDVAAEVIKAELADTGLIRETFRKAILAADVVFVDSTGAVSAVPTNNLKVTSLFTETEPSAGLSWLREWGVVGGTKNRDGSGGAPTTLASGFLVDHKLHTTYGKQPTSQLERVVLLTF